MINNRDTQDRALGHTCYDGQLRGVFVTPLVESLLYFFLPLQVFCLKNVQLDHLLLHSYDVEPLFFFKGML